MRILFVLFLSCLLLAAAPPTLRPTDVSFVNGGVTLRGSLFRTAGAGKHPAILLVAGSGKSTRASAMFRTLEADFTRLGFDVLAYDKRGTGASGGTFDTTEALPQLASDGLAGVRYLQSRGDVDGRRVGVWGVSQGGWLAPLMASESKDVAFAISVSGPGVSLAEQSIYLLASEMLRNGYSESEAERMIDFRRVLWAYYGTGLGRAAAQSAMDIAKNDRWYKDARLPDVVATPDHLPPQLREFMRQAQAYDPLVVARRVHVPVLTIFGAKDSIVPASESLANLIPAYRAGGNLRATFALFPDAGHGLQVVTTERECHECDERATKRTGIWHAAPGFLEFMDTWLQKNVLHP